VTVPADEHKLPMGHKSASLVDLLDRILDKGLVVAGDIKVSLADVELLTVRIRLIICSVDKAEQIGMDWWRSDPYFSSYAAARTQLGTVVAPAQIGLTAPAAAEDARRLEARIQDIDQKLKALLKQASPTTPHSPPLRSE
jgi:hypothetical protein